MKKLKIVKKTENTQLTDVYDIEVANEHHYLLDNGVVSHNSGLVYAASIVVAMVKRKLKEDEDGNKTPEVHGIRAAVKIMKSRYAKPFEGMEIKIPYDTGMNKFSGLIDFFETKGFFVKKGNKLQYLDKQGVEHTYFRKQITDELLMQMMTELKDDLGSGKSVFSDAPEIIDPETGEVTKG